MNVWIIGRADVSINLRAIRHKRTTYELISYKLLGANIMETI